MNLFWTCRSKTMAHCSTTWKSDDTFFCAHKSIYFLGIVFRHNLLNTTEAKKTVVWVWGCCALTPQWSLVFHTNNHRGWQRLSNDVPADTNTSLCWGFITWHGGIDKAGNRLVFQLIFWLSRLGKDDHQQGKVRCSRHGGGLHVQRWCQEPDNYCEITKQFRLKLPFVRFKYSISISTVSFASFPLVFLFVASWPSWVWSRGLNRPRRT